MRSVPLLLLGGLVGCGPATIDDVPAEIFALEPTYVAHVRPLFEAYCTSCHASDALYAGGVELDRYDSAYAGRVHQACVSVSEEVVARFASALVPYRRSGKAPRAACEGWEVYSMPTGARGRLTLEEQVILARWVETGAPP